MQSQLLCQICFESFNSKQRQPTILMLCGHTFCLECVNGLKMSMSNNSPCPTCRSNVIDQKPNYALLEMIESLNSMFDSNTQLTTVDSQLPLKNNYNTNQNNIFSQQPNIPPIFQACHLKFNSENVHPLEESQSPNLSRLDRLLGPLNLPLSDLDELLMNRNDQCKTMKSNRAANMLEWKIEDECKLVERLIVELKPRLAATYLPGLPAYILFMCLRYADMLNDDKRARSLLNASIHAVKCLILQKHQEDVEYSILWLINFFRLINIFKQYNVKKNFSK
jgi:hypothetical protein